MNLDKILTKIFEIIKSNKLPFLIVAIQGILIGLSLNLNNKNILFLSVLLMLSVLLIFLSWVGYSFALSKIMLGGLSRGAINESLKYDSISYLPFTISLIVATIIEDFRIIIVGIIICLIYKIYILIYNPPNEDVYLKEKAQQVKIKHVHGINNLEPDDSYKKEIEASAECPIRKYCINDELRNGINLGCLKKGQIKIKKFGKLDFLNYALGWEVKTGKPKGNLKLFIKNGNNKEIILNKDADNLLNGWNEFKIPIRSNENTLNIFWENTIKDKIYLSLPNFSTTKKTHNKKRNIVVIIFDGVIQETLGAYYGRYDADNISKFFKNSMIFNNAYAQGEWTMPNFANMATSLYPSHHNVNDPDLYSRSMPNENKTMAEILQENGYNTFGYVSHNRVSPGYGHARGFNRFIFRCTYDRVLNKYKDHSKKQIGDVKLTDFQKVSNNHYDITLNAINFLKQNKDTSNFVFLHYFDTHHRFFQSPSNISGLDDALFNKNLDLVYRNPILGEDDLKFLQEIYWQKFIEVDDTLSLLFDYINKYEKDCTYVIFTADHGLPIFDKDIKNLFAPNVMEGRKNFLIESILKIPFMIHTANNQSVIVNDIVEGNIAIMPTVLNIAGLRIPKNIDGISVLKNRGNHVGKGYAIAESCYKDRYELYLKHNDFVYHVKSHKNRETNEIINNGFYIKNLYDKNGNIVTDNNTKNFYKKEIETILKYNKLPLFKIKTEGEK